MVELTPVDYDPFAEQQSQPQAGTVTAQPAQEQQKTLVPVDYDPFAPAPSPDTSGISPGLVGEQVAPASGGPGFMREFTRTVGQQVPESFAGSIEGLAAAVPGEFLDRPARALAAPLREMASRAEQEIPPPMVGSDLRNIIPEEGFSLKTLPETIGRAVMFVREGMGQGMASFVPQMGGMAAGAAIGGGIGFASGGPGGAAGGATLGAAIGQYSSNFGFSYGDLYNSLKEEADFYKSQDAFDPKAFDDEALGRIAIAPGAAIAGIDALSFRSLLPGMENVRELAGLTPKEAAKYLMREYVKGFAKEGATEGVQTGIEVGTQSTTFDRDLTQDEVWAVPSAVVIGGLTGGATEAGLSVPAAVRGVFVDPAADTGSTTQPLGAAEDQTASQTVEPSQTPAQPTRDSLAESLADQSAPQETVTEPTSVSPGDYIEHTNAFGEVIEGVVDSVQGTGADRIIHVFDEKTGEFYTVIESEGPVTIRTAAGDSNITSEASSVATYPGQDNPLVNPEAANQDIDISKFQPQTPPPSPPPSTAVAAGTDAAETQVVPVGVEQPPLPPTRDDLTASLEGNVPDQAQPPVSAPEQPKSFRDSLPEMSDADLMAAYTGGHRRRSELAAEELRRRYPDRDITKTIDVEQEAAKVDTAPTEAQKEAGNYQKGHISIQGLNISIKSPAGSIRSGTDAAGQPWQTEMPAHYGYIRRTEGADGDQVDVYIGNSPESDIVYVVDQVDLSTGRFDEHKALIGFSSVYDAVNSYENAFSDGLGSERIGGFKPMSMAEFKDWLKNGDTRKPLIYKEPDDAGADVQPEPDTTAQPQQPESAPEIPVKPDESAQAPSAPPPPSATAQAETAQQGEPEAQESEPGRAATPRGRKMRDVGEKLEGKRAFQRDIKDKTGAEVAKKIVSATKTKEVFKVEKRDGQTDGTARFAQALVNNIFDFSAYLYKKDIIKKSWSRRSKMPGWTDQVTAFFADGADTDGTTIGSWRFTGPQVTEARNKIMSAAEAYIEFGGIVSDLFEQSSTVEDFKLGLKQSLENNDNFDALFRQFQKEYVLRTAIFSDYKFSTFGAITDESEVKTQRRVEKTLVREKLDKIDRSGMKEYRQGGRDVTETEFKDTFGFRGVEFGEWVSATEGQLHVNNAYDALRDLADRLGIAPTHISLGGKLGFAFGSRGSGEHAAHYEPETNVINLTKTKGDGSLAHEWGHALDYNLRKANGASFMGMVYQSLSFKMKSPESMETRVKQFLRRESYWKGNKSQSPVESAKLFLDLVRRETFRWFGQETDFQKEGNSLGKDYWGTQRELFARAWEAYIHDTLPGPSPYLVHPWVADGAVSKDTGYRGRPYPTGQERTDFNDVFDALLKVVEFSDDGVSIRDGSKLPIHDQLDRIIKDAEAMKERLVPMMREIEDARRAVQQPSVPGGISNRADVSEEPGYSETTTQRPTGDGGEVRSGSDRRSEADVSGPVAADQGGQSGDDRRSGQDTGDRDRVQRNDTVAEPEPDAFPAYNATGKNHVISPGDLDEKRGEKTKAKDNIEILKLIKKIESEGRAATEEEQSLIAKFTGWGSVSNAFPGKDGKFKAGWGDIGHALKNILTKREYDLSNRTIQYAHYTSEIVTRQMWQAMKHFGFKGGKVFEPGMGIGNFIGMVPQDIADQVQYTGLEMDAMSARIARVLYPQSGVLNQDFVQARLPENMFDAAIGNPPFGNIPYEYKGEKLSIHNFFFAKTIDLVAPGGVIAFVTSRFSMDAVDGSYREKMAQQVDLLGAIRLPNTAFKTNANTEVVTDIIFLRKRLPGEESNGVAWTKAKTVQVADKDGNPKDAVINEYFADHPEMVMGDLSFSGTMYGPEQLTVEPSQNSDLNQQISEAVSRLPEGVFTETKKIDSTQYDLDPLEQKEGAYYLKGDTLMQVVDGLGEAVQARGKGVKGGMSKADMEKIKALIPVKDALRRALAAMVQRNDTEMKKAQAELEKAHAKFTKKYGPVARSEYSERTASPGKIEEARNEMRVAYRESDVDFDEGTIDLSHLIGATDPETKGQYTAAKIAAIRKQRRAEIEAAGGVVDEGTFNPNDVPPSITQKYPNLDMMKADPDYFQLLMLENYDPETDKSAKTDVFTKNIVAEVKKPEIKTAVDALNYSMSKVNRIDTELMSRELGRTEADIIDELIQLDMIYAVPDIISGGREDIYIHADEYLSGLVKDALAYAKELAAKDPKYKRNVDALEAVQPVDKPTSKISTNLGAPYFDVETIRGFMDHLGIEASVKYVEVLNEWEVEAYNRFSPENKSIYGTERRGADSIVSALLSNKKIVGTTKTEDGQQVVDVDETSKAQERAQKIQEEFNKWIWQSEHGQRAHRSFNDRFNNYVPRKYNGEHITPAISVKLYNHQLRAVARVMQSGNTYLAHAVGAGKTFAMIASGMEMRRLGIWRKPMYVVPNHMLGQFAAEFQMAYPQAKIMIADEYQFHKDRRKRFFSNVAKSDIDAVIVTDTSFKKEIPVSSSFEASMLESEIDKYRMSLQGEAKDRSGNYRGTTAKKIQQKIEKMEARIKSLKVAGAGQSFTFEEMGVDALLVDEAHYYRKLSFVTNQGNIRGVDPNGSKQAWDLFMKSRYLETINPGRNLVLASGTPITNTLAEAYTLQRFMDEKGLLAQGINNFDSWAATYADSVTELERQASGSYKNVTRLAKFKNLGSLSQSIQKFMDTVTNEQLGSLVKRPVLKTGSMIMLKVKADDVYKSYEKFLADRVKRMEARKGKPEKGQDIILNVINDGRHAAIDMRLIDPTLPKQDSKLELMISNIYKIWDRDSGIEYKIRYKGDDKASPIKGSAQIVFSDLGVNPKTRGGRSFGVYSHIKKQLISMGVPADQIAIANDYESHAEKERLKSMVRSGEIRILIGSTKGMGTGWNVQNRLKALHNLDAMYVPADMEQRNGRIWRQGNQNEEIEIYTYGTEGSYDTTMWGILERKARFIYDFLRGDPDTDEMSDLDESTDQYALAKAMTSGDERIVKKTELETQIRNLSQKRRNFLDDQFRIKGDIARKHSNTKYKKAVIENGNDAIARRKVPEKDQFRMTVNGKPFDNRSEASDALLVAIASVKATGMDTPKSGVKVGEFGGFDVNLEVKSELSGKHRSFVLFLNHPALEGKGKQWSSDQEFSASGAITVLSNNLNSLEKDIKDAKETIERNERDIKTLESQRADSFPQESELEEKLVDLAAVEADLEANPEVVKIYDLSVEHWQSVKADMDNRFMSIVGDEEFLLSPVAPSEAKNPRRIERMKRDVERKLRQMGFKDTTLSVFFVPEILDAEGNSAPGMYNPKKNAIYMSMAYDASTVFDHEAIHALRRAGAFTEAEWNILLSRAAEWREKYNIDSRYRGQNLSEAALNEEAIAEAFRDHVYGKEMSGPVKRVFNRIVRFLQAIRDVLMGPRYNFKTPEQVFNAIQRGIWPSDSDVAVPEVAANDDGPSFILPKNRDAALEKAEALLDAQIDERIGGGLNRTVVGEIGKVAAFSIHPHQIASLHKAFTPVYMAAIEMFKMRDRLISGMSGTIRPYTRLKQKSKDKVHAALEIGRLAGGNLAVQADGRIVIKNTTFKTAHHIKVGETIVLERHEVAGYMGVRKAMDDALDTYIEILLEEYGYLENGITDRRSLESALRKETDKKEIERMSMVLHMVREIEMAKRKGYIPFSRWGEIGIVVKDSEGKTVEYRRVDIGRKLLKSKVISENDTVRAALRELHARYPEKDGYDISAPFQIRDYADLRTKMTLTDVDILAASSDMSADDYSALREMMEEAFRRRGFRAHFFESGNVPGYDADFERAINEYIVSISGHLARRRFVPVLDKAIDKMVSKKTAGQRLVDYSRKYVDYILNPVEEWQTVRQMGFIWYIAGNVASAVTNATQPVLVTMPWFKAQFTHKKAAITMSGAYRDAVKLFNPKKEGLDLFDMSKAPTDVRAALERALADGDFLPINTFDAMASASINRAALRGAERVMRTAQDAFAVTFSGAERLNRIVTFIAAYRLAIDPKNREKIMEFVSNDQVGKSKLEGRVGDDFAYAYADYAVFSTQFRIGRLNRPAMARGAGTLFFQFMSFSLQSMELVYRLAKTHGGQKAQAIGIMLFVMVALAGLRGFPFKDDIEEFIEFMWRMITRTDLDIETEARIKLADMFGPTVADIIIKGAPNALLGIDMSARIGFGNLIPDDRDDVMGVWFDLLFVRPQKSFVQAAKGDYGAAIMELSPNAIKNLYQGMTMREKGVISGVSGDMVIPPEDITIGDSVKKMIGYTSSNISNTRDMLYAQRRASNAVNQLRGDYYDKIAREIAASSRARKKSHEMAESGKEEKALEFKDIADQHLENVRYLFEEIQDYNEDKKPDMQVIIDEPYLKRRVAAEILGAKSKTQRKQARLKAEEIRESFGK